MAPGSMQFHGLRPASSPTRWNTPCNSHSNIPTFKSIAMHRQQTCFVVQQQFIAMHFYQVSSSASNRHPLYCSIIQCRFTTNAIVQQWQWHNVHNGTWSQILCVKDGGGNVAPSLDMLLDLQTQETLSVNWQICTYSIYAMPPVLHRVGFKYFHSTASFS